MQAAYQADYFLQSKGARPRSLPADSQVTIARAIAAEFAVVQSLRAQPAVYADFWTSDDHSRCADLTTAKRSNLLRADDLHSRLPARS
jgi:hypothetical protein